MSIFQCSECGGTFRYENDSPAEWKPMMLGQPGSLPKTCCVGCYANVPAAVMSFGLSEKTYDVLKVCRRTFDRLCNADFQTWYATGFSNADHCAGFLQTQWPSEWARAYLDETGKEWKEP